MQPIPVVLAMGLLTSALHAQSPNPNVVIQWNNAALQGVRDSKLGAPMVARALAIVHTCMYDAWTAFDHDARSTLPNGLIRSVELPNDLAAKNKALSFAAYRASVDLFPGDTNSVFKPLMATLGYDPGDNSTDVSTPSGIGNVACQTVLNFRHDDGSNQLGNLTPSGTPYADYTSYTPANPPSIVPVNPSTVVDVNHWQPLQYVDASGTFVTQSFVGAQWQNVIPFALTSGSQFRSVLATLGPARYPSPAFLEQAQQLVNISASLSDEQKMIAEYWTDGPGTTSPPGHWDLFAQFVSARDGHTLDDDVKMFFALTNAIFDAGIAAWDAKRTFDSVRPVTAISFLFQNQEIRSWGGPFMGTITMSGTRWIPYQPSTLPTPSFPEFVSGHSIFSAAGAEILRLFTCSDTFGDSVTFSPGSSNIEPGLTPAAPVTLTWNTFADAANQAGMSRRYGGIHFERGDLGGRFAGKLVAQQTWAKVLTLWGQERRSFDSDAPNNAELSSTLCTCRAQRK